ncbi:MAG: GNAT family protein [Bacteroidales bacterium]|jgi:RimJ/RimL family protein N-acetyltransferase|nr:GNAT family protein [Bacteroidales bacterium]
MYFKKLVGEKCYLSPIDTNDYEQYVAWLNDEEVTRNLTLAPMVISVENEKEILSRLAKDHNYGIIDKKTDKLIGNAGFVSIDHIHKTAEVGIFIGDKKFWEKGYGTEALSLLIDYAYRVLNLHNIMLRVYAYNERAIACYTKIGFRKIGELREAHRYEFKNHNIIFMDILPRDFYKKDK